MVSWQEHVLSLNDRESYLRGHAPELRGGGYLDDLSQIRPFLNSQQLQDRVQTSHTDVGFRIAVALEARTIPSEVLQRLATCEMSFRDCWVLDERSSRK